ncbi:MAG TPA: proton-conducting transporter membrane subunit [Candidatus Binatia bacterium]|nr:proton-conducting transporter membrane subunit [Candidatus Binatia bacterium]
MPHSVRVEGMTTPGGILLVLAVLVPFVGVLGGLVLGGRHAQHAALVILLPGLAIAIAIADSLARSGNNLVYLLGGWVPPLGVALRADGLAAAMLVATAVVICGISVYALADFKTPPGVREARAPLVFWTLLLAVWGSLNLVFVSGDLFTLYVALELLTFAGVPLVSLDGRSETLRAALRYLLFALLGSMLYLLGAVLLYGAYGTLDIPLLATRVRPEPVAWAATALMTTGLLAKTALFPLHLWLPPAHAGAPLAASAVLSALVVKGSFFLVVRLWFDVMPRVVTLPSAQLLAALGAGAILFGSVVALRQERLKLLIAYSTLAQIGYLFLMFPLAFGTGSAEIQPGDALTGGFLQAISHATAKAAMFMAAGLIYTALGHDRIAELRGIGRARPLSVLAFALGGVALMGLPPSGAYLAKKLLLDAAAETGQWWWDFVLQAGGFFTASYVVLVLAHALWPAEEPVKPRAPVLRLQKAAALALALCSLFLGLAAIGPVPLETLSLAPKELWSVALLVIGGGVLAVGLAPRLLHARSGDGAVVDPGRAATIAAGGMLDHADSVLRQWHAASFVLLLLVIAFVVAMLS